MPKVLITGASRGIGLALVKVYQAKGFDVFASCRRVSTELQQTGAQIIDNLDVASGGATSRLREALGGAQLDILINNAGILSKESLGSIDYGDILKQFEVNALAPLRITEALRDRMVRGAKVALITSRMGSMGDNGSGGYYGYRISKAALNAAGVSLARDLAESEIAVALLHPGFVQTDMVNHAGDISAEHAAQRLAERIDGLNLENSGSFWHSNGELLPW